MLPHLKKDKVFALGTPTTTSDTISILRKAFPDFLSGWRKHIALRAGKPAGFDNEIAEFVHFVVEDLYEKGNIDETRRAFGLLDKLLVEGDEGTRDLIRLEFFEKLHSWRPYGSKAFEDFLGPMSKQVWSEIQRMSAGHSSLKDVIRADQKKRALSEDRFVIRDRGMATSSETMVIELRPSRDSFLGRSSQKTAGRKS